MRQQNERNNVGWLAGVCTDNEVQKLLTMCYYYIHHSFYVKLYSHNVVNYKAFIKKFLISLKSELQWHMCTADFFFNKLIEIYISRGCAQPTLQQNHRILVQSFQSFCLLYNNLLANGIAHFHETLKSLQLQFKKKRTFISFILPTV